MSGRARRTLSLAVALLAASQLAPSCGGGGGGGEPTPPPATLSLQATTTEISSGSPLVRVDLFVNTVDSDPFQAFDLALTWDPAVVEVVATETKPEFDDDGVLFGGPALPELDETAGTLSRIVDLRHGTSAVSGNVPVAAVWFQMVGPGTSTIRILGEVATPDGELFSVIQITGVTVQAVE